MVSVQATPTCQSLLQRRSRWIASIFSGSTAACHQCCGEVCGRSTSSWSCDGNITWSTLASDRSSGHVQTVHLDAYVCAWCCAGLHPKHVDLGDWTAWSLAPSFCCVWIIRRATPRTKFGTRSFSVAGPTAWNALPLELRATADSACFRKKLKTFLFNQVYGPDTN